MNWLRSKKTIAVHSGSFHSDDVFSVAVLSILLDGRIKVVHTRDQSVIDQADYVLDVGLKYDPAKKMFDHHQAGGAGKRDNGIPYATFGLLWKEYGEQIAGSVEAKMIIDKKLVQVQDAADNAFDLGTPVIAGVCDYTLRDYMLSVSLDCESDSDREHALIKMLDLAVEILNREIRFAKRFITEKEKILAAYRKTEDKRIIVLDEDYLSWSQILSDLPEPLFVIKPAPIIKSWKIYCVRIKGEKFKNRLDLPLAWASKKDQEFANLTGVPDAKYCHHARYMANVGSREGAVKLAKLAINNK
jgi:uncharacterized UPF0160 family protein